MSHPRLFRTVLDSGLTILLQERNIESTSFGIGVRFGSMHHHAAHAVEHMVFKGTDTKSYKDIRRKAVRHGGSLDAFTDFYSTFYATKNLSRYAHEAFELLCDMITHATIPEEEMECERTVLLEEAVMRSKEPELILLDTLYRNIYHDHLIGRCVLDNRDLIQTISREEIRNLYRRFYIPTRIAIVGVGQVNRDAVLKTVEKYFTGPRERSIDFIRERSIDFTIEPPQDSLPISGRIVIPETTERVHLMAGFKVVPCTHPDYYPLRVLSEVLGGSVNSRLFESTRGKRGLLYNITCHYDTLRSSWKSILKADCSCWHGILRIYSSFSKGNLEFVESIVKNELRRLIQKAVPIHELTEAKEKLVCERELESIGTFRYMHLLFAAEINNTIDTFDEFADTLCAVTPDDILRVTRQYCRLNKSVWAILKPAQNK